MRRFFVSSQGIKDNKVYIKGSDAHHVATVLRLKEGEKVIVFDGTGLEYQVELINVSENNVLGEIIGVTSSTNDSKVQITLAQGIPKGDKMEFIIQKCTELGVAKIVPLLTERTVVKLDKEKSKKRRERWQKIAQEAAKQCKRATVPEILEISTWSEYLNLLAANEPVVVLWEEEQSERLRSFLEKNKEKLMNLSIIIGPEGGLSASEVSQLRRKGATSVSLGPRILRTETAGMAALTMVLYEFGDLG